MEQNKIQAKRRSGRIIAAASVVAIILLLGLNLLLTYVGVQKTVYVDTTYEARYTVSDRMIKECAFINELDPANPVKITFCADPDTIIGYELTRAVYFLALQISNKFDNVEVETVNIAYNPTAISKYKPTSLSEIVASDIIVSCGTRYRISNASTFWSAYEGEVIGFSGEYKLATLIKSVTAVDRPSAYFVKGHGETYYDTSDPNRAENVEAAALYDMLTDRGLEVKTIDLKTVDRIPDDCVLLVINNPTSDFESDPGQYMDMNYTSETEKIDRYLVDNLGSVMVAKDYAISLPAFDDFLYEWGFELSSSLVKDETAYVPNENNSYTNFISSYDTDTDSYGYAIYGNFASLSSAPRVVVDNTGYITCSYGEELGTNEPGTYSITRNYAPFLFSSDGAVAYEQNEYGEFVARESEGKMDVAAVTSRKVLNQETGKSQFSYVFCTNSPDFFSNETLGNASYANYEVMSALAENMIRTDEYASMHLGSNSANSELQGGKLFLDTNIANQPSYGKATLTDGAKTAYMVILVAIPVVIAGLGIAVCVRRKFL